MQQLLKNLFEFEQPESIGVRLYLRIVELFLAGYTIIYAWDWGFYILRISDVVLPLGLANYLDINLFFGNYLALFSAAILSILVAIAFFSVRYKWLYIIAFLLLHILYVTRFSLGEIPHSSNLVGFGMLGLGLAFCFMKDKWQGLSFAYGFLIFFIGLGYTSAAFSKMIGTGIAWPDGNHLWLWIAEKTTDVLSAEGSFTYTWVQQLALQHRLAATLLLVGGLATEFVSFLLWWKKPRPYITAMIIGMHIGIYYSMNIWFMSYMIGLPLIGFHWHKMLNRMASKYGWRSKDWIQKLVE